MFVIPTTQSDLNTSHGCAKKLPSKYPRIVQATELILEDKTVTILRALKIAKQKFFSYQ